MLQVQKTGSFHPGIIGWTALDTEKEELKNVRIFFDVDTQMDFMYDNGALYVPGAEYICQNLSELTEYAHQNSILIAGSIDRHFGTDDYKEREAELQRNEGPFPDHCMDGTRGVMKILETMTILTEDSRMQSSHYVGESYWHPHYLSNRVLDKRLEAAIKNVKKGIYFEKQSYDVFTNPAAEAFLKKAGVTEAVVYGVATDFCIKAAVLGMLERGIKVYVVEDAIKGVTEEGSKEAIGEMKSNGAKFVTTKQVLEDKLEG